MRIEHSLMPSRCTAGDSALDLGEFARVESVNLLPQSRTWIPCGLVRFRLCPRECLSKTANLPLASGTTVWCVIVYRRLVCSSLRNI